MPAQYYSVVGCYLAACSSAPAAGSIEAARTGRGEQRAGEPRATSAQRKAARPSTTGKTAKRTTARKAPPRKAGAASARARGRGADEGAKGKLQELSKAELYRMATAGRTRPVQDEPRPARRRARPYGGRRRRSAA
ncbi:hypothetical protein ACFW1F_37425 [Streptomyces bungoensis]|uniref:hypothetical protein n=1 Tax=Streptomyces bungoensis TaxID=285568 RepID=UPI0036AED7DE